MAEASYLEMGPDSAAPDETSYFDIAPDDPNAPGAQPPDLSYLELGPNDTANDAGAAGGSYLEMGPDGEADGIESCYLQMAPDEVIPEDENVTGYLEMQAAQAQGGGGGDDAGYMAVEPDWLNDQWDMLSEQAWFRGFQSRDEAKQELADKPPGTFITRVSQSQPGHYALSVIQANKHYDHMLILPSQATADSGAPGNTRYRLGTYSRLLFNTIPKLAAYYIGHPYIKEFHLLGEVKPEKQEGGYMMVEPDGSDGEDYE